MKEMSEVMDTVIKTVNYIKTRFLKSRVFEELGTEIEGHSIIHSCLTGMLVGCEEETLWLVFTT
jgi:hypothetical protein